MIKRASTILLTLFFLLTSAQVWAVTMTSSTTFQKKDGVTGNVYTLEDVKITPPFIGNIKTTYTYNSSSASGQSNKYSVSSSGAYFGYKKTQPKNTFITIPFTNLTIGKTYTFKITFKIDAPKESGDGMEFNVGYSGINKTKPNISGNAEDGDNGTRVKFKSYNDNVTLTYTFTASAASGSYSLAWNWDDKEKIKGVIVSNVSMTGDLQPTVLSVAGQEFCKGEENTYTAVGINEPLTWEYSTDNKATWKKLTNETTSSVTADLQDDNFIIRARNSSGSVESQLLTTFICCSKTSENKDKHIIVYEEYFNLTNGQRRPLDNNARSQYDYSPSGKIGGDGSTSGKEAEYAIVHKASDGGYWQSEPVRQGNTVEKPGESDSNDGFLLVNCGKEKQDFFYYIVQQGNLCSQSLYDFSVDITNVDNTAGQAPVNAIILVHGQKNGTLSSQPLLKIETGNLESGHDWETFTRSFNSDQYNEFRISVRNNYQGTESDVKGNDIGIDNIVFRTCAPEIQIFSPKEDGSLEYEEVVLECNKTITLEAIATYDIKEFFKTPQYLFQISTDKVNWSNVGSVQTEPTVSVTVDDTYLNGFYYQVWVGADATEVLKSGTTQKQGTGCGALTAVSEPISVKYECANSSTPPTLENYKECPSTDGKLDLYTRITAITLVGGSPIDLSNKTVAEKKTEIAKHGKITWYKGDSTTPLTDAETIVNLPSSDNPDTYKATFTQNSTTSTIYEESSKAEVKVEIKKTIEVTVSPEKIEGCLSEISKDPAGRTYYVTEVKPTASPATDYTYTWKNVKTDGTEDATPLKSGDENFYALPSEAGSGTIKLYVESKTTAACPSVAKELTYNIADNPNFECAINVPCNTALATTGVAIELTKISGSTNLTIKRDGTTIKSENLTTGTTTYSYADKTVPASATSVEYEIILGAGSCSKTEKKSYTISSENIFALTSDAKDVDDSENIEYHICKGEDLNYHVISSYKLEPGKEYFKWYRDGELIDDDELKYSNSYKITKMLTDKTVFKVEIVAEEGEESCGGKATVTIYGDDAPSIEMAEINLCYGESTTLQAYGGDGYTWTPSTYLSATDIATPSVTKPEETITYTVEIEKGVCSEDFSVTVNVNPLPVINTIDVKTLENGERDITVNVSEGESPYTYSLDDKDYDVLEEILKRASIGWNQLYVLDANECGSSKMFEIEPIEIIPDKYFSPNGDGVNDLWEIQNLEVYSSYIVEIFTRHGKRIFIQRVGSFNIDGVDDGLGSYFSGWKGEYNGKPMPSDDYWYLITVEDIRKQYTGHFTLKR